MSNNAIAEHCNIPPSKHCRAISLTRVSIQIPGLPTTYVADLEDHSLAFWIRQLSDKRWVTPEVLADFAKYAAKLVLVRCPE